ncbi:MAG TPA: MotA/TolQ/ExbB proton channel family protein [Phycisphaerales bacterium]|nr:MotA/TolQ/ExbB proton channel family protein [Phycisphaerales bacterium]
MFTLAQASRTSLWSLFMQSFDVFTILLIAGSIVGVTLIVLAFLEVKSKNIAPDRHAGKLLDLAKQGRVEDIRDACVRDDSLISRIVRAALSAPANPRAMREAAEMAASEESAIWFRKIDMLNVIGNLGPLVGLAGTVWGMILAFTSLGDTGGQAGPAQLSLGISKALFHTLLGLCLAIPCLLAYGILRNKVDRLCTRAMVVASEIVEALSSRAG